jgi:cytochrome c oxidase subunit 2
MNRRYFVALLAGSSAAGAALRLAAQTPKEIEIMAMKFDFTPDVVKVKRGQPVTLVLSSIDRIHGFKMPDFGVRTDIVPGEERRLTITPDKPGSFVFFCDVFCGDGHEDMAGTLVVED